LRNRDSFRSPHATTVQLRLQRRTRIDHPSRPCPSTESDTARPKKAHRTAHDPPGTLMPPDPDIASPSRDTRPAGTGSHRQPATKAPTLWHARRRNTACTAGRQRAQPVPPRQRTPRMVWSPHTPCGRKMRGGRRAPGHNPLAAAPEAAPRGGGGGGGYASRPGRLT